MKKSFLFLMLFFFMSNLHSFAARIVVSSISELEKAIANAKPGDVITLKKGTYQTTVDIRIDKVGTKSNPITIEAETIAGAEIAGEGGFNLVSPASYIIINGFKFTHKASKAKSGSGTSFCKWTHNIFETPGKGEYLTVAGNDHEIGYNTFQNKTEMGRILAIRGEGTQVAERIWIHHNYFYNFPDQGGANGAETLQFGLSGFSLSTSNSIVEYNLFEKCAGENELISVKASGVVLRYNTIRDCPAQFTLRHGNHNKIYANYFFNTPGIRIFGDDHYIFSNYFENCDPAITIGNGGAEVADGAPLTSHDRPDRVVIAFNTLVNNKKNIFQQGRKDGLGSTFITVAYNYIQGGEAAVTIAGPYISPTWKGNIIYQTKGAGAMPAAGYSTKNIGLVKDRNGIYHLQKSTAAVSVESGDISMIDIDMDGQKRVGKWDVGADQFSKSEIKNHALKSSEVGALAK